MYPTTSTQFFSVIELIATQHYTFIFCNNQFTPKFLKFCYFGLFSLGSFLNPFCNLYSLSVPAIVQHAATALEKLLQAYLVDQSKAQGDTSRWPEQKRQNLETRFVVECCY
jgi:hypothetical protein